MTEVKVIVSPKIKTPINKVINGYALVIGATQATGLVETKCKNAMEAPEAEITQRKVQPTAFHLNSNGIPFLTVKK